jgi:hypothetical protein
MSLIFDVELDAIDGAIKGALGRFVTAGDTDQTTAVKIADGTVDAIRMMESAATHKPKGDVLRAAVRGAFNPFVNGGTTTAARADDMTDAIMGGLHLLGMVAKQPPQPAAGDG